MASPGAETENHEGLHAFPEGPAAEVGEAGNGSAILIVIQVEVFMDIRLHYLEKGKGTPLLLLHGNGESAEYFEHQISFFSEKYHV